MPEPSKTRNFMGRLVDGLLPGSNYNRDTGQYSNIGKGIAGLAAKLGAGALGGPLAGAAAGRLAGRFIDGGFGGASQGQPHSFYSMGANPYSQMGQGYQFPQAPPQSSDPFSAQQPFWSHEQGKYQQPGNLGLGGGAGCVTVDSVLPSHDRADEVKIGDYLEVVDAKTLEHSIAKVGFSESMPQPCVLIRTANGVELECSESAPIANAAGQQILSVDLMGHKVPTVVDGKQRIDLVVDVKPIGERMVQKITCENKFFLAGKVEGRYLLHHNVKMAGGNSDPVARGQGGSGSGPIASYANNLNWAGLKWGW